MCTYIHVIYHHSLFIVLMIVADLHIDPVHDESMIPTRKNEKRKNHFKKKNATVVTETWKPRVRLYSSDSEIAFKKNFSSLSLKHQRLSEEG